MPHRKLGLKRNETIQLYLQINRTITRDDCWRRNREGECASEFMAIEYEKEAV